MDPINIDLVLKFLRRNELPSDYKDANNIIEAISLEFEDKISRVKKKEYQFVANEISKSRINIENIKRSAPILKQLDEEELKWIIRKIANRLYEEKDLYYGY